MAVPRPDHRAALARLRAAGDSGTRHAPRLCMDTAWLRRLELELLAS